MIPKMRSLYESALQKFRLAHPHMKSWTEEQVLEAMFLAASREPDSGIRVVGQEQDGRLRFEIGLHRPDGSDASRSVTTHYVFLKKFFME
jgi:hypothetical protein